MQAHWEDQLLALATPSVVSAERAPRLDVGDEALLRSAFDASYAITARNSKSFFMASGFLPASKRSAVRALYAFCRTVDDIVDASTAGDRQSRRDVWRGVCAGALPSRVDLIAVAWADTLHRHRIPPRYALQLIEGVARDLAHTRYASFEELSTYCYGVASTVGLMSMHIVGFSSGEAVPHAIRLGVALQMTNILRDVGEDFRNGRIYLPRDEMDAFGVQDAQLQSSVVTENWRQFMRFQIDRTRRLYAESWPGIRMLARDGQLAIAAASDLYRGILDKIEENDYDVFARRACLSTREKIGRIPRLFLQLQRGR